MEKRNSQKAQDTVHKAMHKFKKGDLKSGSTDKPVRSRKQAIAIGLSEARQKGAKVPRATSSRRSKARSR